VEITEKGKEIFSDSERSKEAEKNREEKRKNTFMKSKILFNE